MATALSNLLALLALDNSAYLDGLTSTKASTDSFADKLSNVGGAVVVGALSAAATAITAVGIAAWNAGETMDEAMDTIAIATGAVGPELDTLEDDFKSVFASVPTDAKSAADVIGILNSRLDVTGPALQNLAEPLLEVSRLLGGDAKENAELFARVMGDWSLPTEDASASLDALFVAAQQTGAPLNSLMQRIVQYGAPMRNFGFSFEQSAALLAKWEAEGVNVELVMGGLRTAQGKFISQGKDMNTGLWKTVDAIQNAATQTDALAIATKIFGAKAAGDMVDTIRAGKFDIEALTQAMMDADGAIMETGASTMDWGEKWTIFKNKATLALAPIGGKMMEGVGKAMDAVVAIFERADVQAGLTKFTEMIGNFITKAVEFIPILIQGFLNFITFLQNNQGIVIGILAALGVAALAWGITTAIAAWTALVPLLPLIAVILLIAGVAYLLYEAWTNNWGGIQEKVATFWAWLQPILQNLWDWLSINVPLALQTLKGWWDTVVTALTELWVNVLWPAITAVWEWMSTTLFPFYQALGEFLGAVFGKVLEALAGIWQNVLAPALKLVFEWLSEKLQPAFKWLSDFWTNTLQPIVQDIAAWIGEKVVGAFQSLSEKLAIVTDWLREMAAKLQNLELPDWMTPGSPTPWEIGLWGVQEAMQSLTQSDLPAFDAAVSLNAEPFGASGSVAVNPAGLNVSTETAEDGGPTDRLILEDLRRMIADLPNTIARANRVAFEKVTVARSQ
jgi:phage-related minor tail protein